MDRLRFCACACFLGAGVILSGCESGFGKNGSGDGQPIAGRRVTVLLRSPAEYLYSAEVQIAGGQTLEVGIDTGSPLFAVAASASLGGPFYKGSCNGPSVTFSYGGGADFTGNGCNDTEVKLGGLSVGKPLFVGMNETYAGGDAIRYGGFNLSGTIVQGILGLTYYSQARYQDRKVFSQYVRFTQLEPILQKYGCLNCTSSPKCQLMCDLVNKQLGQGGALNSDKFKPLEHRVWSAADLPKVFSMQCCGTHYGMQSVTGKLVFGDVDHSLHSGQVQYTPISFEGLYFLNVTRVGTSITNMTAFTSPPLLPGNSHDVPPGLTVGAVNYFRHQERSFYVDSGNPYLGLGSGDTYKTVQDGINTAAARLGLGPVILPLGGGLPACVKPEHLKYFPDILIEVQGGLTLRIPPAKYLKYQRKYPDCLWPFIINKIHVLGLPVLETYYTVYDQAEKRLGFAPVANCEEKRTEVNMVISV